MKLVFSLKSRTSLRNALKAGPCVIALRHSKFVQAKAMQSKQALHSKDSGLLGCDAVLSCMCLTKLRRDVSPTSSRYKEPGAMNAPPRRLHGVASPQSTFSLSQKHNSRINLKIIMELFAIAYLQRWENVTGMLFVRFAQDFCRIFVK
jgi:hypothetical protein